MDSLKCQTATASPAEPGGLLCFASPCLDWVANLKLWKQGKVAIGAQQRVNSMGYAQCRDAGVMHDPTSDPRAFNESSKHCQEIVSFGKQYIGG